MDQVRFVFGKGGPTDYFAEFVDGRMAMQEVRSLK